LKGSDPKQKILQQVCYKKNGDPFSNFSKKIINDTEQDGEINEEIMIGEKCLTNKLGLVEYPSSDDDD
jgi:hypothetical protein